MITHCKGSKIEKKMAKMKNVTRMKSTEESCDEDERGNLADEKYGDCEDGEEEYSWAIKTPVNIELRPSR